MSIDLAKSLYALGQYPSALQAALEAASGNDAGAALLVAAKCLVAIGHYDDFGTIIALAQQNGAAPERIFFHILHDCLADGLREPLIRLDAIIPDANILHPIALYHASCARMMLGDEDGAANGFNRFRLEMPRYLSVLPFGTDDDFNIMFRQGTLVLPPDQTAERIAIGAGLPSSQADIWLIRSEPLDGPEPIILCCADASYIEYFLPRWLAAAISFGYPIHIHVVNEDRNSRALIDRLASEFSVETRLSASVSRDQIGTATSYACARFEVMPVLLRSFQRPILALDIDVAALAPLQTLAGGSIGADFACFETGRCEPASFHQASIMAFAPTPAAIGFAEDLAVYCRPKIAQAVRLNWMLDQAALYSVIRLYRRTQPAFTYQALDQVTGRPLSDFIAGLASDEEKHAIKVKKAGLASDAPVSGEVAIAWQP